MLIMTDCFLKSYLSIKIRDIFCFETTNVNYMKTTNIN